MVGDGDALRLFELFELLVLPFLELFAELFVILVLDIFPFVIFEFIFIEFEVFEVFVFEVFEFIEPPLLPEFTFEFVIFELVLLVFETLLVLSPQAIEPIDVIARKADKTSLLFI